MFIIDEFDEVLKATNNTQDLDAIINECFKPQGINPMYALFSATVDEEVKNAAFQFINQPLPKILEAKKEALKLDNVKQLKIKMADDKAKRKFLEIFYQKNPGQAMIFVNQKKTATFLKELLINIGRQ